MTVFEALHDMSYPVDVLRAARDLLAEGDVVLVGDEHTAESFGAAADDLERLFEVAPIDNDFWRFSLLRP